MQAEPPVICASHNLPALAVGGKNLCAKCLGGLSSDSRQRHVESTEHMLRVALQTKIRSSGIPEEFWGKGFDAFVAQSESAKKIATTLQDYCERFELTRGRRKGFIFVGLPGTAKTHLACAMVNHLTHLGYTPRYASLPKLTREMRSLFGKSQESTSLFQRLQKADLLVLDEIDLHGTSDNDYNWLYEIINARYEQFGMPTVVISNRPIEHLIKDLDERIISRLLGGTPPIVFDWASMRGVKPGVRRHE